MARQTRPMRRRTAPDREQAMLFPELQEWEGSPEEHAPFHFWKWDGADEERSQRRLGERLYTMACLLFSAMHDRMVSDELAERCPNWSAICSYYSMVHALRLVWLIIYGGYPTGHAPMGNVLAERGNAAADWHHGDLQRGRAPISGTALQNAIRHRLQQPELADRLPQVGNVFLKASRLRNDTNYESLLLAHQYYHGPRAADGVDRVNVQQEFQNALQAMTKARDAVLDYMTRLLNAAFDDEVRWFCPRETYRGPALLATMLDVVNVIIARCPVQVTEPATWWDEPLSQLCHATGGIRGIERLTEHFAYDSFNVKRTIMEEFRRKVRDIEGALG